MVNEFDVENPGKEELKKIYNDQKRYPWIFDQLDGYQDFEDKYRMQVIVGIVQKSNPSKVLDNGCGSAVMSRALADAGFGVVGFDISAELLKQIPHTKNLKLVSGDSDELPFRDSSFGCVICSEVLEHIKDNRPAITEIARVLDNEGIALITVPNWSCYDCLDGNFKIVTNSIKAVNAALKVIGRPPIYQYGVDMHFHKMFPWQWRKKLESSGLEVVQDRAVWLFPYIPKFRYVERWVYSVPGIFPLKAWLDDALSGVWPFKYLGIGHLFVCRKSQ